MSDLNKMVKVTNRSSGYVFYKIPNHPGNANRVFTDHETKMIPMSELVELSYQPGGKSLLYNYLYIEDEEVLHSDELNINEVPEYYLEEKDIPSWLNTCTLDEFKDALEFAPQGIKDLIRTYSVTVPLNDSNKREAMKDMMGFDVTKAIDLQKEEAGSTTTIEPAAPARRSTTTSYKKPAAPAKAAPTPKTADK